MVSKANRDSRDGKDDKDSNRAPSKDSRGDRGNRGNRGSRASNKDSRDSKGSKGNSLAPKVVARRAALTAHQTGKAIRPTEAAVRPEVMIAANSAPNCAKVCGRPKTYAATWARIAIWRTASIKRFKAYGAPTTRSCATTCRPRCC